MKPGGNMLDRAIGYIAPGSHLRRLQARDAIGAYWGGVGNAGGSYDGAKSTKTSMLRWRPPALSADQDTNPALPTLRARSRDLNRNAPLATGAINIKVGNVVGTGLNVMPEPDADILGLDPDLARVWAGQSRKLFKLWGGKSHCHAARQTNFAGLQDLVLRSTLESGDVFTVRRMIPVPGDPFELKVQLLEADRVSNPQFKPDSATMAAGVEFEPDTGAPVAYHYLDRHPGRAPSVGQMRAWRRIAATGGITGLPIVMHHYRLLRPELKRGVPFLAPVIETLKQMTRYTEAEIMAAVINSCFATTVKTPTGDGWQGTGQGTPPNDGDETRDLTIQDPGAIVSLQKDETIEAFTPGRPTATFDPFLLALLRQIGPALEIPVDVLILHFTASYSASRAALLQFQKFVQGRRAWLAMSFCQPWYELVITEGVSRGILAAPGFFDSPLIREAWLQASWTGPGMGLLDPKKECEADAISEDRGWKSGEEIVREKTGNDWDQVQDKRGREVEVRREKKLVPAGAVEAEPVDIEDRIDNDSEDETRGT